MNKKLF